MKNQAAARKVQEGEARPEMKVVIPSKETTGSELQKNAEDVNFLPVQEQQQPPTIEELKRKAELLTRFAQKHSELIEKRKQVENFKISHDSDTATVMVHDAKGEVFNSNSPKTIGRLIEFWFEEFTEAIQNIEKQMREIA